MDLRQMRKQDVQRVSAIAQEIMPQPWSDKLFLQSLQLADICWVLQSGIKIVGFVIFRRVVNQGEILNIGVLKSQQKKGLGTVLMRCVIEDCKQHAVSEIFLEVRASNLTAIGFYRKNHFIETGRRVGYYPTESGREDAVLMRIDVSVR